MDREEYEPLREIPAGCVAELFTDATVYPETGIIRSRFSMDCIQILVVLAKANHANKMRFYKFHPRKDFREPSVLSLYLRFRLRDREAQNFEEEGTGHMKRVFRWMIPNCTSTLQVVENV